MFWIGGRIVLFLPKLRDVGLCDLGKQLVFFGSQFAPQANEVMLTGPWRGSHTMRFVVAILYCIPEIYCTESRFYQTDNYVS